MRYLLGIDDTDSKFGHCTTHLGYLILSELPSIGCSIPTYPRLVRLNPNIPFKTRGNAAVCLEFETTDQSGDQAFKVAERLLRREADVENGANSALVMLSSDADLSYFRELYRRALSEVVSHRKVAKDLAKMGVRVKVLGNGMGVVGAAASIGFLPVEDEHTYELICYRLPENCGKPREPDAESVREMETKTFPHTFNSFDHESGRVLISPKGPDPVLAGIRGDSPEAVINAFWSVEVGEEPLGHVVYVTNQCTDAHLSEELSIPLKAFSSGWLQGRVLSSRAIPGSHLEVALRTGRHEVHCMVYEPSGDLRRMARRLRGGDEVKVYGGVRRASSKNPAAINVERIDVLSSENVDSGTYLPSSRSQRHLTKQLIRYGREDVPLHPIVQGWVQPAGGVTQLSPP